MISRISKVWAVFVSRYAILSVLFYRDHQVNQKFIHRDHIRNKNPFVSDGEPLIVEIIGIKGKWINYRHTMEGSIYQNESNDRSTFNFIFAPLSE